MRRRGSPNIIVKDKRVSFHEMTNIPISAIQKQYGLTTHQMEQHVRRECWDAKPMEMEKFYESTYSKKE